MKLSIISIFALLFLAACEEGSPFKEGKTLAGKQVDKQTLNLGYTTYMEYCIQCHGIEGKGNGPSAIGLLPPPRDFTQGLYKFPWVPYGELPHDEDLYRIIRHGLKGTAMLAWDISDRRLDAVTQYIKTFAPQVWEGADKVPATKFELPVDPFGPAKKAEAIEKGKRAYHITAACTQCHRGYESKDSISQFNKELNGAAMKPGEFAEDLYQLKPQDSEYNYKALPPDFTYHQLRSVVDRESLLQRLMYGVTGSGMPGWKDVVSDEDLWALAYYVEDLMAKGKDPVQRRQLLEKSQNKK